MSKIDRQQDTEEEKQDRKYSFFLVFRFCLFFFTSFLNSTIKRGTKSHQFPLVLCILLEKALKIGRERYRRSMKEGTFFFEMGTQDYKMESVNKRHFLGTTFKDALSL